MDRKRNLEVLSQEQLTQLEEKLSQKLTEILKNAHEEANKLLNLYGMKVKIAYELDKE